LPFVAVTSAFTLREEFNHWKIQNGKTYADDLEDRRFGIWAENFEYVREHNIRYLSGDETFTVAMNKFADLTEQEFANQVLMQPIDTTAGPHPTLCKPMPQMDNQANPASVDWRTKGYVTPVKNQGQCGSCWSFSTTGSTEGAHFKKTGKLVSLSEQNLVDCSKPEGNMGCNGGLMDQGFTYIIKNGGIDTEESYKYTAKDGQCHFNKDNVGATISECFDVKQQSEADLETALASVGPISVAMDAHLRSFQLYKSGIYHDKHCSSTRLDHGVLAVGYNNDSNGKSYWIVKNSWGAAWGHEGYFWLAKDKKNACGIATVASYPVA